MTHCFPSVFILILLASLHAEHGGISSRIYVYSSNFSVLFSAVTFWNRLCLLVFGNVELPPRQTMVFWGLRDNWWYLGRSPKGHLLPRHRPFLFPLAHTLSFYLKQTLPPMIQRAQIIESGALKSVKEVKGSCYSVIRFLLFLFVDWPLAEKQPKGTRLQKKYPKALRGHSEDD